MLSWIKPGKDIDFMAFRRYAIGAALLVVIASTIAFVYPGPRLGTDFLGGTEVEVAFTKPVTAGEIREAVQKSGFESPDVVAVDSGGDTHQFLIRVKEVTALTDEQKQAIEQKLCLQPEEGKTVDLGPACPETLQTREVKFSPGGEKVSVRYASEEAGTVCGPSSPENLCPARDEIKQQLGVGVAGVELRIGESNPVVTNQRDNRVEFFFKSKGDQLMDGLRDHLGADAVPAAALRVEWIGAKATSDLRDAAIKSVLITVVLMMVYIAFRFDVRFAPGAILALIHDVLLAIGAMILAQREITLTTVAALLTIVGYSINDTVVVYDRIRENLGKYRKMTFVRIINRSITETIGRTIRTSVTTAASLLPFLFFGTGVIKDFAFTLLVGVIGGTFSSIFIASPLTELINRKFFGKAVTKKRRVHRRRSDASSRAATV
jgi:preprotein translocase subunit SecF